MAGAWGYLLKQVTGIDLVGAVRTVAGGGSLLDPRATGLVLERLRRGDEPEDPRFASLSPQERRILSLIADGLTNRQIGAELFLAEKTVKKLRVLAAAQARLRPPHRGRGVRSRPRHDLRTAVQRPVSSVRSAASATIRATRADPHIRARSSSPPTSGPFVPVTRNDSGPVTIR